MRITIPLMGRGRILLLGAGGILLAGLIALGAMFLGREPTLDEQRAAHVNMLVKLLERYHAQHGFYPQPAMREETVDGVRHVWGYRPDEPALPSCTIVLDSPESTDPDPLRSVCGGNVYDADGRIIGWKGTLAHTSALNSVEVAKKGGGRYDAPLSELISVVPVDPAYALHPALEVRGFGEYVYAVRAPEDGAEGRGGVQYQLAATVTDPATGEKRTVIRGDYFVPSDEQDLLPPSLIGPGILLDRYGNPEPGRPVHTLLDGQREGYPNPLLGEGESILRLLTLRGRAERLREEIAHRRDVLERLSQDAASTLHLVEALAERGERVDTLAKTLTSTEAAADADALEAALSEEAEALRTALQTFLAERSTEVHDVLRGEVEDRDVMEGILSGATLRIGTTEELILLARDELLKYLDGEGIEEQARERAGRRIESAVDGLPDLTELFADQGLTLPQPFLSEDVQDAVHDLRASLPAATTGTGVALPRNSPVPMLTTLAQELTVLFAELRGILQDIQEDIRTPVSAIKDIDESLRRLARALATEKARIVALFSALADEEVAAGVLAQYEELSTPGNEAEAIRVAAERSGEFADFFPLLFSPQALEALALKRQAGIPDFSAVTHPLAAEYKGIPYPLP